MAFTRGVQSVEVIANDPDTDVPAFFLIEFRQECSLDDTCTNADLYTSRIEKNWTSVSVSEDVDLDNSSQDCSLCHQPEGPGTPKILRMQEIQGPWTHWMRRGYPEGSLPGNEAVLQDFHKVHGSEEDFAGIPAGHIDNVDPEQLEKFITVNSYPLLQPNQFSNFPQLEVSANDPRQPWDNTTPGKSPTWEMKFSGYAEGSSILVPYHDVKVTDPERFEAAATAYREYLRNGDSSLVPDMATLIRDDAQQKLGIRMQPNLTARELIIRACNLCHNDVMSQDGSRARFNVDIDRLDDDEKMTAIERLRLPKDVPGVMPPAHMTTLTEEEKQLIIDELSK